MMPIRHPNILKVDIFVLPNPDKPEQMATKALRHKAKPWVNNHLCVFVSWWRKGIAIIRTEFTIKSLIISGPFHLTVNLIPCDPVLVLHDELHHFGKHLIIEIMRLQA